MRGVIEQIVAYPQGVDAATLAAIQRYAKLFWLNNGPYNNLTARKFVLTCTPEAFKAAVYASAKAGAKYMTGHETIDQKLARLQPMFFDPTVDPIVTNKTPGAGKDILQASANNLYSGVSLADLKGFTEKYGLNSRLVKQDGKLVEEVYTRRRHATASYISRDRQAPRSGQAVRRAADGQGARCADQVLSAPARTPTARPTTSPGCRTRTRRSTPSTASSRSTSIRAASRAAGKAWSSTSTRRRRSASRRSPTTRSGSRITCRGMRSTARPACRASSPTRSTSSSKPATRAR